MTQRTLADRLASARKTLAAAGQEHTLAFYGNLADAQRDALLTQIEGIDWPEVARLIQSHVLKKPEFKLPEKIAPAPWYANVPPSGQLAKYKQAREAGERLLREGKVAAFTVAGGQGTRLGWDGPKGTFPATPIRKVTLFGSMAEYIRKAELKYGKTIPWYIMTSPINHADTLAFFEKNNYLGLSKSNVMLFPQAMMPAIGMNGTPAAGKVLLEAPSSLALSPNGHGGSLKALYASGAIADMKKRGVEHISYTQVDNPIVKVVDPMFLGLHAIDRCQMSSKMLPKREPLEKLGNFCLVDGKMTVIEYSNLPDDLARQTLPNGDLRFRAGSIAIHAIRADFVEWLNTRPEGFALPFNRAEKKVPCIDASGAAVKPEKPNAIKLETFVFDALPFTSSSIIYETDRVDEFAPIKNADEKPIEKSVDSPYTSGRGQTERAARWLAKHGVKAPRKADGTVDATIEISQLTAIEPDDLKGAKLPKEIAPGSNVVL